MEDSLHDYIHKAIAQGQSADQIKQTLISAGWEESAVVTALHDIQSVQQLNRTLPQVSPQPTVTSSEPKSYYQASKSAPTSRFNTSHFLLSIVFFLVIGGSVIGGLVYYYRGPSSTQTAKTDTPDSQNAQKQVAAQTPQPRGLAYTNSEYKFSVTLPENWSIKEFPFEEYAPEKRIAFGPASELPNEFFANEDYVWMRIYAISEEELYKDYVFLTSLVGKDAHATATTLAGKPAMRYNEFIATEYNKYVYEIHLLLESQENSTSAFTPESMQILQTFAFTQ